MFCMKCNQRFPDKCVCADRDERLNSLARDATHVVLTYCSGCGEHVGLCECPEPKPARELRNQGRIVVDPRQP